MKSHGGNIYDIERKFKIDKDEIIDFSGNINPFGVPISVKNSIIKNIEKISIYPDLDYCSLRKKISSYVNCNEKYILVSNGTTELISSYIKIISPKKAVILSPVYSEYEREVKNCGGEIIEVPYTEGEYKFYLDFKLLFNTLDTSTDMLIICNPNNPTGAALSNDELEKILDYCQSKNIFVMLDETYIEFSKYSSSAVLVEKYNNLFTIRGTSKFFGCPGIRLGYGICGNSEILNNIKNKRNLWSVNMFAVVAGEAMFTDTEFINKTKEHISSEREKLMYELSHFKNLKAFESHSNFILVRSLDINIKAEDVFYKLLKHKIVIRNAGDYSFLNEYFFRFCILSEEHNKLLIEKLKDIFEV